MFKKFKSKVKGVCSRAKSAVRHVKAGALALFLAVASPVVTFALNARILANIRMTAAVPAQAALIHAG